VVGENESAEYLRQSRTIAEIWSAAGVATRFGTVPGANHFTAIAPLADPGSRWCRASSNWRVDSF
jgi:arylformamidase